ncbi:putative DUF3579 domain-containing protein [Gammaproteobacteria bacterium]
MKSQNLPTRMIIQGITQKGEKFRPSDWAERLQDCIATRQDCNSTDGGKDLKRLCNCMSSCITKRKAYFSPHIHINFKDEVKSLVIDRQFCETKPMDYEFLLNFVKANNLNMVEDWD